MIVITPCRASIPLCQSMCMSPESLIEGILKLRENIEKQGLRLLDEEKS
jgi:hypothetical protein